MEKIRYVPIVKTIPEYSKRDQTLYTCSVGLSLFPQVKPVRLYPLPIITMDIWGIYDVPVERNKYDSRKESWKLLSESRKEGWDTSLLYKDVEYHGCVKNKQTIYNTLLDYLSPSISKLNKDLKSIGLLELGKYELYWGDNKRYNKGLFEDVEMIDIAYTKDSKEKECRIKFSDADGKHDLQYNSWDIYEYQRKFGANDSIFDERFVPTGYDYLLVGNMHNHRNTWIALKKINIYNLHQMALFN